MPLYLFERVIILKGQMTSLSAVLIQNIMSNDIDLLKKSDLMLLKGLTFSDWRCLAVAELHKTGPLFAHLGKKLQLIQPGAGSGGRLGGIVGLGVEGGLVVYIVVRERLYKR